MDSNLISPQEYKSKVNTALQSCPEYDLGNYVKRSTVNDVCYGCNI